MPVELYERDTDRPVATITDEQFEFLVDELEEESPADRDYYLDAGAVDMLEDDGADPELLATLRRVLAGRDGVELRWERV